MKTIVIEEKDAGQRFDKYIHKLLGQAPGSFIFKMLRKKNITLNDKKASGSEKLLTGDRVKLFLSEETILKFSASPLSDTAAVAYLKAHKCFGDLEIIYENMHVLIVNKPPGILTQKATDSDMSLNEWLIGYLLSKKEITPETLTSFRPSVCNRLDRNTSGMVICSKTLKGSQEMSLLLKERRLQKFYRLFVKGQVTESALLTGYLVKDEAANTVRLSKTQKALDRSCSVYTRIEPVKVYSDVTLLEAELITGKTHQIRAHLADKGNPLVGDYKYGDFAFNECYKKKYQIQSQLLHCYRLTFPEMEAPLKDLSTLTLTAKMPDIFLELMNREQ